MLINTKLNIGDEAFFMLENKVTSMPIGEVKFYAVGEELSPKKVSHSAITYCVRIYEGFSGGRKKFKEWRELHESLVFSSKEELLKSL